MSKKILIILPKLIDGGAEKVVTTLVNKLDHKKFNILLLVVHQGKDTFIDSNVDLVYLNKSSLKHSLLDIFKYVKTFKPNVVFTTHVHYTKAISILTKLIDRNIKYVARESSIRSLRVHARFKKLEFLSLKIIYNYFVDTVIAQSLYMKNDLIDNIGVNQNNITVIPNLIDIELVKYLSEEDLSVEKLFDKKNFNIVCVGRLEYVKGFDLLIKEVSFLKNKINNAKVYIFGDGKEKESLLALINEFELGDIVYLMGFSKNPYPYIKASDLVVLPSRIEGFPNVVLEAVSLGKNVLAYNAPGGVQDINFIKKVEYDEGLLSSEILDFYQRKSEVINYKANELDVFLDSIKSYEREFLK